MGKTTIVNFNDDNFGIDEYTTIEGDITIQSVTDAYNKMILAQDWDLSFKNGSFFVNFPGEEYKSELYILDKDEIELTIKEN